MSSYSFTSGGADNIVDVVHDSSEIDFVMAIGGDQKLLRRLNELDNAETVTTSRKGSDAKWRLKKDQVLSTLAAFDRYSSA